MYGNSDKEIENYNNNYINTHLLDMYDESQYMCTNNDIVLEGFSDNLGSIYYIYFEPSKVYQIFQKYTNKNLYYIKVFGFNIYLLEDDIKQLRYIDNPFSLSDIIIPTYAKKISIDDIIEYYKKHEYNFDGSRDKTFYSFTYGTMDKNTLYNQTFCKSMDYFDDYSLELFINKFKDAPNYKYKPKETNNENFIYLIPKTNITFQINNTIFYLEEGRKYKFLDKNYIFVCHSCFNDIDDSKYVINDYTYFNFITYRDIILNNSHIVKNISSDISIVNYIEESVGYIYYINEMIENIYDDEIYIFNIKDNKVENIGYYPNYYGKSDILLYGRVIKEFMEQYPKVLMINNKNKPL